LRLASPAYVSTTLAAQQRQCGTGRAIPANSATTFLGLRFISAQELNEEGGKLVNCASVAFAREQTPQDRVPANTRIKLF
jgi:hypothetical protein